MSFWQKMGAEPIDIIEWNEPAQSELLAYRFPRHQNEIKNGAQLIVREGQAAAFVNEGQLADVYPPGLHTLATENMPVLSTLQGWAYGFQSPFKAEVYFISTRRWTDLKWGTQNPIMLRDPEFGPVRVRAFGTYAFQVSDPGRFLRQLVATDPTFEGFEIAGQLRNTIVARFADALAQARLAVLDLAGHYDHLSQLAMERIRPDLAELGLALVSFYVENVSLPPEVEQALDKRTQMGVLGNLEQYTKFQAANALGDAAKNAGGLGSVGAGLALGQQLATTVNATGATPPPLTDALTFFVALNGRQEGPFDLTALTQHIEQGRLTRTSLVWKPGMANWSAAGSVAELQRLFATLPPPLPATVG